ncbi:MAG: DUF4833 domain-containing protein [Thermoflexibacteraceae bacterium]|jgi:hypothetical protein
MQLFFFLLFSYITFSSIAQNITYPTPITTAERLFYIQRNANTNTIVYDANFTPNKDLDKKNPIKIYWITYEKGGMIEDLNYEQRTLAYGVKTKEIAPNHHEFTLVAYKKLTFTLQLDTLKKPVVTVVVNGKTMKVDKIFIQAIGKLKPKVQYIDFYGTDLLSNATLHERLMP